MYCNRPDGLFVHLACLLSIVNQFCKNDFLHLGLTAIHQPHPAHGVVCFQILGGPGLFCHSRHHAIQQVLGVILGCQQIGVQLAFFPVSDCLQPVLVVPEFFQFQPRKIQTVMSSQISDKKNYSR